MLIIPSLFFFNQLFVSFASQNERNLLRDLFDINGYEPLERPGPVEDAVPCQLTFGLKQILDVDEKNQIIKSNVWLTYEWYDERLIWNHSLYNNISELRVRPTEVWKPDILLYNNVQSSFEPAYPALVIISSNGWLKWMPPGIVSSTCKIDITWFPFDEQNCKLQYGTWTHDGWLINLQLGSDGTGVETDNYVENGEWDLITVTANWTETMFECCPEPYYFIEFWIKIRRRTLSYGFNLIIPCLLISLMSLLCFILPAGTDEKLTLGISIFMSLTVFLIMIGDKLPPTSESYPLIGTYFMVSFLIVSLSQVFSVLTLNFHHRNPDSHDMGPLLRCVFLDWLPWLLLMERPGYEIQRGKMTPNNTGTPKSGEQLSKSLLSNITGSTLSLFKQIDVYKKIDLITVDFRKNGCRNGNCRMPGQIYDDMYCFENAMLAILKQLSKITKTIRASDEEDDVIDDWQFAAMALDRLCLIIFSMVLVFSTCSIIFAAPHISF